MRTLSNLLGFGKITMIDDTGDLLVAQVTEGAQGTGSADRIVDKVPRMAEFGFASAPPLGALAMMLRRTADRARGVVIATSHAASRPRDLEPGDTVLYDVRSIKVQMSKDGLLIDGAGLPIKIQNAPHVTITGAEKITLDAPMTEVLHDMTVAGTIHATGQISTDADVVFAGHSTAALRAAYGKHVHGGVKAGGDASGGTDSPA